MFDCLTPGLYGLWVTDVYDLQVNIFVEDGEKLGLMIRGGAEYGLGIFIAGVDRDCAAEYAGLKVSSHCKIIVIFSFICGFIINN